MNALCQAQENHCKVKSLTKTNGQASEVSKVPHYRFAYQAEVECLKDNMRGEWPLNYNPVAHCNQAGEVKKVVGVFEFVQTEKGWQPILSRDNNTVDAPKEIP